LTVTGIIVVQKLSHKDDSVSTEPQTTDPVATEPQAEPVELTADEAFFRENGEKIQNLLAKGDFAACMAQADKRKEFDAEGQAELLKIYQQHQGKTLEVDGKKVAWEEYFFWVCHENPQAAANGLVMLLSAEEYEANALKVLSILYYSAEPEGGLSAEQVPATYDEAWTAAAEAAKVGYEAAKAEPSVPQLMVEIYGVDLKMSYDLQLNKVGDFLKKEGINGAALATHYRAGTSDLFETLKVPASWDEYVFWELWVLNYKNVTAVTDDSFNEELHTAVSGILSILYDGQTGEPKKADKVEDETLGDKLTGNDGGENNEISKITLSAKAGYTNAHATLRAKMDMVKAQETAQQETEPASQETEAAQDETETAPAE
jgi:hypothetical protein